MAKVYEALQRAEEARRRRASGGDSAPATVPWEGGAPATPLTGGTSSGLFSRLFKRRASSSAERREEGAKAINKRRLSLLQPESYVAEQFRTLRGRIDSMATQRPIKTVAVSSANEGEGKSTASINLAAVTAMSVDRKVLLVDCDLRRPKIHESLCLEPKTGLAEILLGRASLDEALLSVEGMELEVLPVKMRPPNPSELLASAEMTRLIEDLSHRYDRVILDTPACLGLPDSKVVSELCDGLVMVVRADRTARQDVAAALDILDRRRVIGMVLNDCAVGRHQYGYY